MPVRSTSAPLVGRQPELAALARLAGVGVAPGSGLVLLSGDAGIGKSRLLDALVGQVESRGWLTAVGHCLDLGASPVPYLPVSEVLTRLAARRPDQVGPAVRRWPALQRLVQAATGPLDGPPVERGALFESVHALLADLGRRTPTLVVVEDLHWADQSTYDLLSFLFARGFAEPVSVVASYRSDDLHRRHPLRAVAAGWSRLPGVSRLELPPLTDPEVRDLVRALDPGAVPLGSAEVAAVVARAEGNPFFAEELAAAVGTRAVPADLSRLLLLRLDALPPEARLTVQAAAAGGPGVADVVLATVTGLDPARFDAAARVAVEHNVLVPVGQGYRFRHSLLAEAVYDDLLPGERRRLHGAYLAALRADPRRGTAADLARHAVAAGDLRAALTASVRAGDDAATLAGPDEAYRHYAVALDLLESDELGAVPGADPVDLAEKASGSAVAAGLLHRAEAVVARQLHRLPGSAPPADRARLLVALSEATVLTDAGSDGVDTAAAALDLLPPEPATLLRGRAVAAYALALAGVRRNAEATRWAEEGLALPPEVRPGMVTANLQGVLAKVTERQGDAAASRRLLRGLLEPGRGTDAAAEVRILHQLGLMHLELGELSEALDTFTRGAQRSTELGRPYAPYGLDCRMMAGLAAYQLGRWDEALRLAYRDGQSPPALATAALTSVELAVRAGRGQTTGWRDRMASVRPEWTTDGTVAVLSAAAAIELAAEEGDLVGAVAVHDEAVDCVTGLWGRSDFQARIRLTAVLLGRLADALPTDPGSLLEHGTDLAEAAERATSMGRNPEPGPESQAWLARLAAERLRLAAAAGQPVGLDALAAAWAAAVTGFERYPHVFERARSLARYAEVLRAAGDGGGAAGRAEEAAGVARALGAAPLLRLLRGPRPGAGPLTTREAEVLGLVADGRSNSEIGERLGISTKTASVHVSNILAKLGARTRTEAAALARRRGLLG